MAINFGKPDQKWLDHLTPEEARQYEAEGQFAPGSMLPKVQAAVKFAESKPGRTALITLLEKAKDGIAGKTGTAVCHVKHPKKVNLSVFYKESGKSRSPCLSFSPYYLCTLHKGRPISVRYFFGLSRLKKVKIRLNFSV